MNGLRNAELVDKVVILVEKYSVHGHCLALVEEIIADEYPNYNMIFQQQVGMPVNEYITKVRLHKAEGLLEDTEMDFKEISKMIGMNGYFEFTQLFKRFHGVTPVDYRNQLHKQG
ncbi:two-component system response regulator YesN [Solibacillus kalamii]|uniref:AraC-type DNA-binding domain-containing protein n=2 Tax=Solibacillus TaxID=648800 RepID=F2F0B2_SOLSS|nr:MULTISPECIES: AraC family transcriptional regulator [Solibacillus]MBM7666107.1 two-component system response regulator YesN [Solibacillus kalamii]OBW57233.1 AraC family transcriptional regulator [Solibacillus silvestris]OUZ38604.1 AraC family transcriptional regulator [Solibacillus kalamii]BAK15222.1 AraC-type DNA-binding domain-containing protein [Solibacillus silvestris StLB046]